MTVRVLFVCLGNICRSPMAEAVFRHRVKAENLGDRIEVDSAGTGDWHIGEKPHRGTRDILKNYQISDEGICARQFVQTDFSDFDYIIAMDDSNMMNIRKLAKDNEAGYVAKLLDFHPEHQGSDVPDPYFTGNFEVVYEMVKESCDHLLQFITERETL